MKNLNFLDIEQMDFTELIENMEIVKNNVNEILKMHQTGEKVLSNKMLLHFRRMQSFLYQDIKLLSNNPVDVQLTSLRSITEAQTMCQTKN